MGRSLVYTSELLWHPLAGLPSIYTYTHHTSPPTQSGLSLPCKLPGAPPSMAHQCEWSTHMPSTSGAVETFLHSNNCAMANHNSPACACIYCPTGNMQAPGHKARGWTSGWPAHDHILHTITLPLPCSYFRPWPLPWECTTTLLGRHGASTPQSKPRPTLETRGGIFRYVLSDRAYIPILLSLWEINQGCTRIAVSVILCRRVLRWSCQCALMEFTTCSLITLWVIHKLFPKHTLIHCNSSIYQHALVELECLWNPMWTTVRGEARSILGRDCLWREAHRNALQHCLQVSNTTCLCAHKPVSVIYLPPSQQQWSAGPLACRWSTGVPFRDACSSDNSKRCPPHWPPESKCSRSSRC